MNGRSFLAFFDLDGTLEDSRRDMAESINRVRGQFGLPPMDIAAAAGLVNKGMDFLYLNAFPEMTEPAGSGPQLAHTLERIRQAYTTDYGLHIADHTVCYEGIPEALAPLSGRGILVVYTNKPESLSRLLLERLRIAGHFQSVIGCDTYPETKPSPEPLKRMMQEVGFADLHRTVMIGDSQGDMKAARGAGVRSVFAAWGYDSRIPDPAPEIIARHPSELPDILSRL